MCFVSEGYIETEHKDFEFLDGNNTRNGIGERRKDQEVLTLASLSWRQF